MVRTKLDRKLRYQHVYDLVLAIMAERDLKSGDRLHSTTELAEIAQVSTISVRRALDELERAGKITRRQGLGTFGPACRPIFASRARTGWTQEVMVCTGGPNALVSSRKPDDLPAFCAKLVEAFSG
jgi:GntR family transcriptional regulator